MNLQGHLGTAVLTYGLTVNLLNIQTELFYHAIFVTLVILGAKTPDLDLKIKHILPEDLQHKRYLYHRQFTHSLFLWVFLLYISIFGLTIPKLSLLDNGIVNLNNPYLFYYVLGVFSHLIADILTGSIPLFLYGHYGKGLRIGIKIKPFNQLIVKLGDWLMIPMVIMGVLLALNILQI